MLLRHAWTERISLDTRGHDKQASAVRQGGRNFGEVSQDQRTGPMNILNDDSDRLLGTECPQNVRDYGPLALIARRVGHRVIDGAFLLRLGEVKQVIEKDAPLRRQKPAANGRVGGSLPRRCVAAAGDIREDFALPREWRHGLRQRQNPARAPCAP